MALFFAMLAALAVTTQAPALRVCMETRDPPWAYIPGHEWDVVDRPQ